MHRRICSLPSRAAVYLVITVVSVNAVPESASALAVEPPAASPSGSSMPADRSSAVPSDSIIDSQPKDDADHSRGLFGSFRVGPVVGIGLPNLLDFGVTSKLTRYFGAGFHVGVIPNSGSVTTEMRRFHSLNMMYMVEPIHLEVPFSSELASGTRRLEERWQTAMI